MQYPMIAQPQYAFAPTIPTFKSGGLASVAKNLSQQGRYGDSMLVHMRPDEVAGLASIARAQGGSLTINPETGLVEAWGLKSIFKPVKSFADDVLGIDDSGGIAGSLAKIVKPLGPIGTIAAGYFGGPWGAALMAGLQGGDDKKAFNFKKAATAAALAYGAQAASDAFSGANGMSEGVGYGDVPSSGPAGSDFSGIGRETGGIGDIGIELVDPSTLSANTTEIANAAAKPSILDTLTKPSTYTDLASKAIDPATYKDLASSALDTVTDPQTYSDLASGALDYAKQSVSSPLEALKTASMATTAVSGIKTLQELEKQKEEAERILAAKEAAKAEDIAWAQSVMNQYPINYRRLTAEDVRAAGGGIIALAGGRYLQGPGDGTSDSIPARIDGKQEARLADGEYVIDARTVSELGNGSSNAGARKLRDMVNRVHAARRKAQRGKPSSADKYLPV